MPIDVLMPQLSPTMTEGRLAGWMVKEGDKISAGDVIAEVETDKATMEVEASDDGIIHQIIGKAGEDIVVGSSIAVLKEDGEKVPANYKPKILAKATVAAPEAEASVAPAIVTTPTPAVTTPPIIAPVVSTPIASGGRVKASPLARRMAKKAGVDLSKVIGSGPKGRIIKKDIAGGVNFATSTTPQALQGLEPLKHELVPHSLMRKSIATRLVQAKQQVPHFYLTVDVNMDSLQDIREQLNSVAPMVDEKPAYKVTVNDLIIKATAMALRLYPDANAGWSEEGIIKYASVDVSVAVSIEGGLITPILKGADKKSVVELSAEMRSLAGLAKKGKLQPEQYQGGSISVSNLGMFGIKKFDAIINPPQAAILACGVAEDAPVVENGELVVASIMSMTLSVDHRVIDGVLGAQLLGDIKYFLENPVSMLV